MRILIETIPHANQRYETVGDWIVAPNGDLTIRVSDMGNDAFAFLVGVHELIEAVLCKARGISDAEVTAFDEAFEFMRGPDDNREPGDEPMAPYRREHCFATGIERLLCSELHVNWADYERAVLAVGAQP